MTNPTDPEIAACIEAAQVKCVHPDAKTTIETARAILAKWCTPPAVTVEPFCYVSVNKQGDITRTMKRKDRWTNIPLYATPQHTKLAPAARQKALEEAAEVCAEISTDYWMGDAQFEAATRCRNAILAMGKQGGV